MNIKHIADIKRHVEGEILDAISTTFSVTTILCWSSSSLSLLQTLHHRDLEFFIPQDLNCVLHTLAFWKFVIDISQTKWKGTGRNQSIFPSNNANVLFLYNILNCLI